MTATRIPNKAVAFCICVAPWNRKPILVGIMLQASGKSHLKFELECNGDFSTTIRRSSRNESAFRRFPNYSAGKIVA
jgi:hypothetical protein